jgi:hypothetical protein
MDVVAGEQHLSNNNLDGKKLEKLSKKILKKDIKK